MDTKKLYYSDAYCSDFKAKVLHIEIINGKYYIVLDKTYFYPQGGGQPGDIGVLSKTSIIDCIKNNETIYHISEYEPDFTINIIVDGKIDILRRYGFMQNHTADHIFSGIVQKKLGYNNIGFHLSKSGMTMDFDGVFDNKDLIKIEDDVNKIIFKNINVEISNNLYSSIKNVDFRSKRKFGENELVRLVKIGEYDLCACAGLHVANTLEIGIFHITNIAKYKKGSRITALCGQDARQDYMLKDNIVTKISQMTSSKPYEIDTAVFRITNEFAELKKLFKSIKNEILSYELDKIMQDAEVGYIIRDNLDSHELLKFAIEIAKKTKIGIALTHDNNNLNILENSLHKYVIFSFQTNINILKFVDEFNLKLNGNGKVKENMAQGVISSNTLEISNFLDEINQI